MKARIKNYINLLKPLSRLINMPCLTIGCLIIKLTNQNEKYSLLYTMPVYSRL